MNGLAIKSIGRILAGQPQLAGRAHGDFDGDGKADLVWRNFGGNNQTAIWLMDGLTVKWRPHYPDPNYAVTRVGDLDGDASRTSVGRLSGRTVVCGS
jgi:hypothetical protein